MRNKTKRRRRPTASRDLLAEITDMEKRLAVDETGIENWGDELANEEAKIVDKGTEFGLTENEHQNELAMDNWPTDADNMSMVASRRNREIIAKRLIKMANALLED
jgi:hypothetical protein